MTNVLPPKRKIKIELRLPPMPRPRKFVCVHCDFEDEDAFNRAPHGEPEFCWACRSRAFRRGPPHHRMQRVDYHDQPKELRGYISSAHYALWYLEDEIRGQEIR